MNLHTKVAKIQQTSEKIAHCINLKQKYNIRKAHLYFPLHFCLSLTINYNKLLSVTLLFIV